MNPRVAKGRAHYLAGNIELAEREFLASLVIDSPDTAWDLALLALRQEEWFRGWALAEARFTRSTHPIPRQRADSPCWEGELLQQGTVVLWGDQTHGEQIHFARFIPAVLDRGPRVRLEVASPLVRLLAAAFPSIQVTATGKTPSVQGDFQLSIGSLPRVLHAHSDKALASDKPYLTIPDETRTTWRNRLGPRRRPRIGLAWGTEGGETDTTQCSPSFDAYAPLFALAELCEFHSLQTGPHAMDLAGSGVPIVDWSGQITDLLDGAALIAELDLVITVDNAVAHLAGALGCEAWMAIPFVPDWRWSERRGDRCLWYPKTHLFRQPSPGDWQSVFNALAAQLGERISDGGPAEPPQNLSGNMDEAACTAHLAAYPLDRQTLARLAKMASSSAAPRRLLPVFHRGRTYPEAAFTLARLLVRIDKKKASLAVLRSLTRNRGDFHAAWILRSDVARQLHFAAEATDCAHRALALNEADSDAWLHLANALREGGNAKEALSAIEKASMLAPRSASVLNNLGVLLKEDGQLDRAIAIYRRALALDPSNLPATTNLGSALRGQGVFDESLHCFRKALDADANNPDTWFGLGNTLKEMGRTNEAIDAFRRALAIKPDHVDVQVNLSLLLLLCGDFSAGWDMYEQRFHRPKNPVSPRRFPQPWWRGEQIQGKHLLIWGEQGAGDKIMIYRLLPELIAAGAKLTVETDARLMRLMGHNLPAVNWIPETSPPHPVTVSADLQTPSLSLARFLRRDLTSFGAGAAYLDAPPDITAQWQRRLAPLAKRKVGLVWAGSPTHNNNAHRSLRLAQLAPLFNVPETSFVSLQVGKEVGQIGECGFPIADFSSDIADYADTAAIISGLDLVIAVDTSVAHLAAALGVPTWIMIPFHPDWRWLETQPTTSPWYQVAHLFRQTEYGNWSEVIDSIADKLNAMISIADSD